MKNYFEKTIETETRRCESCARETLHDRSVDGVSLWMCRDPQHVYPTREEQSALRVQVVRVVPPMIGEDDYVAACAERDYYKSRCEDLERALDDIRAVIDQKRVQ